LPEANRRNVLLSAGVVAMFLPEDQATYRRPRPECIALVTPAFQTGGN
jgi:hypothetical protein